MYSRTVGMLSTVLTYEYLNSNIQVPKINIFLLALFLVYKVFLGKTGSQLMAG